MTGSPAMGMGGMGSGQLAMNPAILGSMSLFGGLTTTATGLIVPASAVQTPDTFCATPPPGAFDAGITPRYSPILVDDQRPILYLPPGVQSGHELQGPDDGAVLLQDGSIAIAGPDSGLENGLLDTSPHSLLIDPTRSAYSMHAAFAATLSGQGSCGCAAGKCGSPPAGSPPTIPGGGGGSGGGKRVDAESYWKVVTQGGPMFAAAIGDFARTRSTAATLFAAGTYADDPLGTQDPDSIMSVPMQMFLPPGYFGKTPTATEKGELDMLGAQYAQVYFWGKLFKYVASIGGSVAAMHKIATDPKLSDAEREDLAKRNYYDWLGNAAFLVEKGCYAATIGTVGLAQFAGRESPLWDVGYVGGALILNAALALATVAWYAKVKCGASMVACEKDRFMAAHAKEESYDIDTASVNVALFNFANAVPRVFKHFTAHATTLALGAYLYAPQLFSFMNDSPYVQTAIGKLGEHTPAENIYRWTNFGFIVPRPLVYIGLAFAIVAPIFGVAVSASKLRRDIKEHVNLRKKDPTAVIPMQGGSKEARLSTVGDRIKKLRTEHIANALGMGGAICVLGTGFAVSYPATEPLALFLTALYGTSIFLQYGVREKSTVASMFKAAPVAIYDYFAHFRERRQASREKSDLEGSLLKRMMTTVRETRAIIKKGKKAKMAEFEGLGFADRWQHRFNKWGESFREWKTFIGTYMKQKSDKKKLTK